MQTLFLYIGFRQGCAGTRSQWFGQIGTKYLQQTKQARICLQGVTFLVHSLCYCSHYAYYYGIFSDQSKSITTFFCCTCAMMHVLFRLSAVSVALPYFLYLQMYFCTSLINGKIMHFLYLSCKGQHNQCPLICS
jgi:hypothetical protein